MAGGLVQIIYIGNSDKVLTQHPQVTYFKLTYCRHTAHSIQDFIIKPESTLDMSTLSENRTSEFVLPQNADLVFRPWMRITLPDIEAKYEHDADYYINKFMQSLRIRNATSNIILSSLRAMLYNYLKNYGTIYINDDTVVSFNYEHLNFGTIKRTTGIPVLNDINVLLQDSYSQLIKCDVIEQVHSVNTDRHIYYAPHRANYLTTELSKLNLSDDIIYIDDDFFELFRTNLFKYITSDNENKFLYSLLNNKTPDTGYLNKNQTQIITDEVTYSLDYLYSNMKMLFIYNNNMLKCAYYVSSYSYSSKNYVNKIIPIKNLYLQFDELIQDASNNLFISNGFNSNRTFNIHSISATKSDTSYDISSSIIGDNNSLYFIYIDNTSNDQGRTFESTSPGAEDYYDLYYKNPTNPNNKLFGPNDMLLPLCMLKYNAETEKYDQIVFDYTISDQDMIYVYKDVLIFDQITQKIEYVLIGNMLHEIIDEHSYDISTNKYTDNMNLGKSQIIENGVIKSFNTNEIQFLVSNDENGVILVDDRIYIGKDFISPFQIKLDISSNIYNRTIPVVSVSNSQLDLDSFVNTNYILDTLKNYNTTKKDKLQSLYQNVINTKTNNLTYITNVFESFLNQAIYYKFYNNITYKENINTVTMVINPRIVTNVLSYINTFGINGTDRFYCGMQDTIGTKICNFIDKTDVLHTENMRSISKNSNKLDYINRLVNIQNNSYSMHIPITDLSIDYSFNDTSNNLLLSKIVFQLNADFANMETLVSDLSLNLPIDSGYYYVENMLFNTQVLNGNTSMQLTPLNEITARQYYIFNLFFNASVKGESYPFTSFYILPNDLTVSDVTLAEYSFIINRATETTNIYNTFDTITNNNNVHYTSILYADIINTKPRSIEMKYILYDYAQRLYFDVKDRIPIDVSDPNLFAIYNDMKMHENLLHIRRNIFKNHNNGNVASLIDLNTASTGSTYYLDCNICMTDYLDHVIINNSLRQNIESYIITQMKPDVDDILLKVKGVLNFYEHRSIIGFYDDVTNIDISSTDVNITLLDGMSTIRWYLFCINAIKSDITGLINNNDAIQIMTNINVGNVLELLDYIDISENIFSGSYLGTKLTIDSDDMIKLLHVSKLLRHMMNHIRASMNDRIIQEGDGIINVYTSDNTTTVLDKILINSVQFETFINVFPQLYGYNFMLDYQYKEQLLFFNTLKQKYLNFYSDLITTLTKYGSYSYNMITDIKQYMNFDMNDYISQLDWLAINKNYDSENWFIFTGSVTSKLDDKFKYRIVNNDNNVHTTSIKSMEQSITDDGNSLMVKGRKLMDIKFENLISLVGNFNKFFSYNYTFYSDYQLIYVLYFYYYKTFTFSTHTLTFDNTDNTSYINNITDGVNNYPYSWISFDTSDIIRYIVRDNKLYDVSNNIGVNYYVTSDSIIDFTIITCDATSELQLIGPNIVDASENHMYTIRTKYIYDGFLQVGSIYSDKYGFDIYDISGTLYKYEKMHDKSRVLFAGYQLKTISDNTIEINSVTYNVQFNTFHDDSYNIKFKFMLPFLSDPISTSTSTNLYPIIVSNETQYELIPDTMYGTTVDITSVFRKSFSTANIRRSIKYLQDTINETLYTSDIQHVKTIVPRCTEKVLHNICKNGVLPVHNYIDDTIQTCNYNNWLKHHSIDEILDHAKSYTTPNKLMIFNETRQVAIELNNLTEDDKNDSIYFIASRSNNTITESTVGSHNLSINDMIKNAKILRDNEFVVDYTVTNKIKNYIMDAIIDDICGNVVSNIYDYGTYFDVSTNVIHANDVELINENSYFIRSSVVISMAENTLINILTDGIHVLYYKFGVYVLLKSGKPYHITTVPSLQTYDTSYNDCKLAFDAQNVKIEVTNSAFPKNLRIEQGKLIRLDATDQEFYIDTSGNLKYDYSYDISMHQIQQITKSFNDHICCDKSDQDISGYVTDTIVSSDISIVYDDVDRFIIMDSSINIIGQTIMITNGVNTVLEYVTWQDEYTIKITTNFIFTNDSYVTIILHTPSIIKHIGYDAYWYKTVFFYYESMHDVYQQLSTYVDINDDTSFKGQKFSCNNYINNLYGNLYVTINKTLFESTTISALIKRDKIYNLTSFNKESIQMMFDNLLNLKNTHHNNVRKIQYIISRDPVPKCNWIDYIGNFVADRVKFNMGNETIEEITDYVIHTYNMRGMDANMEKGYNELIGHNTHLQVPQQFIHGKVLYVPLPLCFTECVNALPLLALINTRLSLFVTCKSLDKLIKYGPGIKISMKKKFKMEINASYVFLEQNIREKFARSRHEYLVQTKQCYEYSIETPIDELLLDYENPCKEMSWFYMDQKIKDSKDYWNFTGIPQKIYNKEMLRYTNFDKDDEIRRLITQILKSRERFTGITLTNSLTDLPVNALSKEERLIVYQAIDNDSCKKNNNPFLRTKLNFNGQNRFDKEGDQSNIVESTIFLNERSIPGLNIKTFGRPTEMSHMGSLNLSSAHDMKLEYELNCIADGSIVIIINTYQIIRIASGFGTSFWR
jgi:hypothetical protein